MYEQLKSRLGELLRRPRTLAAQTQRQLQQHLAEHGCTTDQFLLSAVDVLEDFELDILFGPVFTPTFQDREQLADLLFHWRPTSEQLAPLTSELVAELGCATIRLPDGVEAKLSLHEVMIERYVRLLRLEHGADPATAATMREALPAELWNVGVALLCERGMTSEHQKFFAAFVTHVRSARVVSRGLLETAAEFIAGQKNLNRATVLAAAEALMRATEGTAAYAAGGHAYWSPDVAQHHHYRGQGRVDQDRFEQRQAEVERVAALVEDLKTFQFPGE